VAEERDDPSRAARSQTVIDAGATTRSLAQELELNALDSEENLPKTAVKQSPKGEAAGPVELALSQARPAGDGVPEQGSSGRTPHGMHPGASIRQ